MAYEKARKYKLADPERFVRDMACESWDFTVLDGQSFVKDPDGPNGRENSWGAPQWNLPSGLKTAAGETISMEIAIDLEPSLDAAAYNYSIGNARHWSCHKLSAAS